MHNRPPVRQQFGYQGNIRKYYWPCAHPFSNSWCLPSILTIVQVSSPKKRGLFAHLHICCSSCCCVDMGVDVCTTSCDLPMQVERGRDLYFEETSSNCCSLSPSPPDRHPHRTCKQILPCMQESLAKEASHHTFVYSVFFIRLPYIHKCRNRSSWQFIGQFGKVPEAVDGKSVSLIGVL